MKRFENKKKSKEPTVVVPRAKMIHPSIIQYDNSIVQNLWEDSISLGIPFTDPFESTNLSSYRKTMLLQKRRIYVAKKKQGSSRFKIDFTSFRQQSYRWQLNYEHILRFEQSMWMTDVTCCSICNKTRLTKHVDLSQNQKYVCSTCNNKKQPTYTVENIMQPVWYLDGVAQYVAPKELLDLTIGEQLLIQIIAPFVPIVHIKNGVLGSRGHTCSFMQEVSELCHVLPRQPSNVTALKFIRHYKSSTGDVKSRIYSIRKSNVMGALQWLVKYHVVYREMYLSGELKVCEDNLNWMGSNEEADLISVLDISTKTTEQQSHDLDRGVAPEQCMIPLEQNNHEFEQSGIQGQVPNIALNQSDREIIAELKSSSKSNEQILNWPTIDDAPVSEYAEIKLFTLAFPWLFPGGVCDFNESCRIHKVEISQWLENLIYYKDGRFARDPIWCFFALNYKQRHQNTSSGGWFVKSFASAIPNSLSDLKEKIAQGDDSFVSKLAYFGKTTTGSSAYWRFKKSELFTWINHHVSVGHGAPTVFMTLSCAEFHWPDLIRVLEKRIWIASNRRIDKEGKMLDSSGRLINLMSDPTALNKAVNDYSIIVQEFFQIRVRTFLEGICKIKFGIDYYWGRYEFATGRGQIHLHLLGIQKRSFVKEMQKELHKNKGNPEKQGDIAAAWAEEVFGMSATFPKSTATSKLPTSEKEQKRNNIKSCGERLAEVSDYDKDKVQLCSACQIHLCSNYCLRKRKGSKKR